jgi:nucleoid-associated protein YgaU
MQMHPSGKSADKHGVYVVKSGDTLWSIAGQVLRTNDASLIASYWPKLYRLNQELVGSNPNLINPGQVLRIPPR